MSAPAGAGQGRSIRFWVTAAAGWVVIGFGLFGIVDNRIDTRPAELARFVIGAAVVHDLVVAPLALLVGLALTRACPPKFRRPVQAATVVSAMVLVWSLPSLRGYGQALEPGGRSPVTGVVVVLGIVWAVTAVAAVAVATCGGRSRHRK